MLSCVTGSSQGTISYHVTLVVDFEAIRLDIKKADPGVVHDVVLKAAAHRLYKTWT